MTNGEKYRTAKERAIAFADYCSNHYGKCDSCAVSTQCHLDSSTAALYWLDLEVPAEEPLPCPFCGNRTTAKDLSAPICWVECTNCEYRAPVRPTAAAAISAHNRVARAVTAVKDKEHAK